MAETGGRREAQSESQLRCLCFPLPPFPLLPSSNPTAHFAFAYTEKKGKEESEVSRMYVCRRDGKPPLNFLFFPSISLFFPLPPPPPLYLRFGMCSGKISGTINLKNMKKINRQTRMFFFSEKSLLCIFFCGGKLGKCNRSGQSDFPFLFLLRPSFPILASRRRRPPDSPLSLPPACMQITSRKKIKRRRGRFFCKYIRDAGDRFPKAI